MSDNPKPECMTVTPERELMIKKALIRQYEDQYDVTVTGWEEIDPVTNEVIAAYKMIEPA